MKEEITLMGHDLPQLRQMVLSNTERINRNEQTIDEMRKSETEKERARRERDEYWENSRQEHERRMRSIDARLDRIAILQERSAIEQEKRNRELKEQFAETDKRMDEGFRKLKEQFAETDRRMDEGFRKLREQSAETDKRMDEGFRKLREQSAETDKKIKELSTRFGSTTGNIIEGLMSSTATDLFREAGFDMHTQTKNACRKSKTRKESMEVDVILYNDTEVIAVEVKANCRKSDVDHFLRQMEKFRRLFPPYENHEVMVAIAAINYEDDADKYASGRGLIVVRTDSSNFFSISPVNKSKLRRF